MHRLDLVRRKMMYNTAYKTYSPWFFLIQCRGETITLFVNIGNLIINWNKFI